MQGFIEKKKKKCPFSYKIRKTNVYTYCIMMSP